MIQYVVSFIKNFTFLEMIAYHSGGVLKVPSYVPFLDIKGTLCDFLRASFVIFAALRMVVTVKISALYLGLLFCKQEMN